MRSRASSQVMRDELAAALRADAPHRVEETVGRARVGQVALDLVAERAAGVRMRRVAAQGHRLAVPHRHDPAAGVGTVERTGAAHLTVVALACRRWHSVHYDSPECRCPPGRGRRRTKRGTGPTRRYQSVSSRRRAVPRRAPPRGPDASPGNRPGPPLPVGLERLAGPGLPSSQSGGRAMRRLFSSAIAVFVGVLAFAVTPQGQERPAAGGRAPVALPDGPARRRSAPPAPPATA